MDGEKTASLYHCISPCRKTFVSRQTTRRLLAAVIFICLVSGFGQVSSAWGELIFRWKIPEQVVFPEVDAIAVAPGGYLWISSTGGNIFKFDPNNSTFPVTINDINFSYSLAVDSSGNVYGTTVNGIQKFDSNGNLLAELEIYGDVIAIDGSDNIYVTGYNRIQKFDSSGNLLAEWGSGGSGDGQFGYPLGGMAADSSGNVYVADTSNNRIQKFDSSGNFLAKWGTKGSGDGQFRNPYGMAVDSTGNVYVTDNGNNRVQKFDSSGNFLAAWQISGIFYEGLNPFTSSVVAVDGVGNVYVNDHFSQLQKFDDNGTLLAKWGTKGSATGFFNTPLGVALDSSANIYVADSGNKRIQKFDSSGNFLATWGSYGAGAGQFTDLSDVAVDSSGDVYVSDSGNHRIQKFDRDGSLLATWGNWGGGNGQLMYPNSVAVDRSGHVYVADTGNHRIQRFDGSGNFMNQWGTWVSLGEYCYTSCFLGCSDICTDEYLALPADLAVDAAGNVYLLQRIWFLNITTSLQVFKFDGNGHFLTRWDASGSGIKSGWDQSSSEMAADSFNNIYVTKNKRIKKFDSNGNILATWRNPGTGDGQFGYLEGIAVDSSGNVYVADTGNHRIQKFEQTFKINGAVKTAGGTPVAGVLMTLSGDAGRIVTTNSNGKYTFEDVPNGSYTVTPGKAGYGFTPASTVVTIYGDDIAQRFIGATVSLSGVVKKANGTPIAGALMTLSGDAGKTVTTDSNGRYKFNRVAAGNYTITPTKNGFTFTPASITLDMSGASVKKQNFTGARN